MIQKISQYKSDEQIQAILSNIQQEFYTFQQKYTLETTKLAQIEKQKQLKNVTQYLIESPFIKNYYVQNITHEQLSQLSQLSQQEDNNIIPNSVEQIKEEPNSVHFLVFQDKEQSNTQTMNALYNLKIVFQEVDPLMRNKNLEQEYNTQKQITEKGKSNFITVMISERETLIQTIFETVLAQCITQAALRYKNITYLYYCITDDKKQKQYLKLLEEINNSAQVEESEKQFLEQFGESSKQSQKIVFVTASLN